MLREENFIYCTGWCDELDAAGAAAMVNITIAADASFKAYYITIAIRQGDEGAELLVANWAGVVNLNDSAIGKDLMNIPIPVDSLNGTGQLPYNLAPPRIFAARSTIIVTFTTNVVTRTQCSLSLHGSKLYAAA